MRYSALCLAAFLLSLSTGCGGSNPPPEPPSEAQYTTEQLERWRTMLTPDGPRYSVSTEGLPCLGPADALVTVIGLETFGEVGAYPQRGFAQRVTSSTPDVRYCVVIADEDPYLPRGAAAVYMFAHTDVDHFFAGIDALYIDEESGDVDPNTGGVDEDRIITRAALAANLSPSAVREGIAAFQPGDHAMLRVSGAFEEGLLLVNGRPYFDGGDLAPDELIATELAIARQLVADGARPGDLPRLIALFASPEPSSEDLDSDDSGEEQMLIGALGGSDTAGLGDVLAAAPPPPIYSVPVQGRPQLGPADALVTLVLFSDFECPFCSRLAPTLTQLRTEFGADLRIVFRHNPLPMHSNAMPAARAAEEVFAQRGADAFFRMHDLMFLNQRALTSADLESYAQAVGANLPRFRRAMRGSTVPSAIQADMDLAARIGARGTPYSFVNGVQIRGAVPLAEFQRVIRQALADAQARVAAGTPRQQVYDAIIAQGSTNAPAPAPTVGAPPRAGTTPSHAQIAVPPSAPTRGTSTAPVTVQVFSDFECPFCSRLLPALDQISHQYGRRVRIVWRNYPLAMHPNAFLAAEAAMEVFAQRGNDGFWAFHDLLFAHQRTLTRPDLERYASQVRGVNMTRFRSALDQHIHQARVQQDIDAVTASGLRIGTPTVLIDDEVVEGAQPLPRFTEVIDRHLAD